LTATRGKSNRSAAYFERFGLFDRQILTPPHPDLNLVVVIPCFDEPDLLVALQPVADCSPTNGATEIIVVVNAPENAAPDVHARAAATFEAATKWTAGCHDPRRSFHILNFPCLPEKRAGVGLARKIGMDEAARRLEDVGRGEAGVIACFDADCVCDSNYLAELERHFEACSRASGCSIYFEHPLEGPLPPELYVGIRLYELHLRYYVKALRWCGFPHAYHTVGSSMAVRAGAYQRQGGMNQRQAGEDFYFLHKIIPLGGFTELNSTRVIPSPRLSERVPFGTGKALRDWKERGRQPTYSLRSFSDLRDFFALIPLMRDAGPVMEKISTVLREFLETEGFAASLEEIRSNTSSPEAFRKRFFGWCNAFRIMKFLHHARDLAYGEADVVAEAGELLDRVGKGPAEEGELLKIYRELDRAGWKSL
jgi:hypothetical protein